MKKTTKKALPSNPPVKGAEKTDNIIMVQGVKLEASPLKIKHLRKIKELAGSLKDIKVDGDASALDLMINIADAKNLRAFAEVIFHDQDLSKIKFDDLEIDELTEMANAFFLCNPKTTNALMGMLGNLDLSPLMNSAKPGATTP